VERARRHRGLVALHPDGSRVHEHVGVGQEYGEFVEAVGRRVHGRRERLGLLDRPVGDVDRRPSVLERERRGATGATRPDHHRRLARQLDAVVRERPPHALDVGGVAGRLVAREVDRVDGADARGQVVDCH
jgi:hypothetical protein